MKFIFNIELKEDGYSSHYSVENPIMDGELIDVKAYRKGLIAVIQSTLGLGILDADFKEKLEDIVAGEWKNLK